MTIVRLAAENIKRLRAVTIAPDGNLVVLSGRNGQGKTSVLDAITYALAGKHSVCAEPIRRGEEAAEIVCDLGDLVVRRRFIAGGGTTLEVTSRDGLRYPSPQTVLDKLVGELTFDPLAFSRRAPAEQQEILRALIGLDFTADDKQHDLLYGERTLVNREHKAAEARLRAMPTAFADTPSVLVQAGDVAGDMQKANVVNSENDRERDALARAVRAIDERARRVEELRAELAKAETSHSSACEAHEALRVKVAAMVDVDTAPILQRMRDVDAINQRVRSNQARIEVDREVEAKRLRSEDLTNQIDAIKARKAEAIGAAAMPVPGLGLSDGGVTLNGLPLDQASAAEQLRVSVAIGLAMNPRLRVLLLRDASLLDQDSLRLVAEMAQAAGAQVWCEMVTDGSGVGIVIEDGMVKEQAGATA